MPITEILIRATLAIGMFAAAIVGLLWFAFTCKVVWQMHTLARLRRTQNSGQVDTRTASFER